MLAIHALETQQNEAVSSLNKYNDTMADSLVVDSSYTNPYYLDTTCLPRLVVTIIITQDVLLLKEAMDPSRHDPP